MRAYRLETQRQKIMVRKSKLCEARLLAVSAAFRVLMADEDYINLLRAGGDTDFEVISAKPECLKT